MKNIYIQLLHNEIQKLESKVSNLKKDQNVSFSFFRDSFKLTQEIMRLLHELEFVQVEDMKSQMEKLVLFLSETETSTPKTSEESEKMEDKSDDSKKGLVKDNILDSKEREKDKEDKEVILPVSTIVSLTEDIPKEKIKEDFSQFENKNKETKEVLSKKEITESNESLSEKGFVKKDAPLDSTIAPLSTTSRSLNDILPSNHTLLDTKQSISLNDRFLFQRELFDNDRHAMNDMMIRLQAFKTFEECELYLKENTDWNFNDEAVEKFLEMLKKSH